jgi:hypothetical protein
MIAMRSILSLLALFVASIATSQVTSSLELVAQHDGLVGNTDLAGYNTYRLFLHFPNDMDLAYIIWGDEDFPMEISTDSSFYQSPFGGSTSSNINPAFFSVFPELVFDSYLALGFEDSNGSSALTLGGLPDWAEQFETGDNLFMNDSIGGAVISFHHLEFNQDLFPLVDNKMLVGQFTTKGNVWGTLNIDYFSDYNWSQNYQEPTAVIGLEFGSPSGLILGCTDPAAENYSSEATVLWDCQYAPGDLTSDGEINIADLLLLLGGIGCLEDCGDNDLNGDGVVNITDLLLFLGLL